MDKSHRSIPELTPQDLERFWSYVNQGSEGECWEWTAGLSTRGYGRFSIRHEFYYAHRVAYLIEHGVQPAENLVCHHCDNPPCCNPAHLYAGAAADNSQDMVQRGRQNTSKGDAHYARRTPEKMRRGEQHHKTTLTEHDVRTIRMLSSTTNLSQRAIAEQYNVTREAISRIVLRKNWGHVE